MADQVVVAQPGADRYLRGIDATVVEPEPGWTADPDTTVLFVDHLPANLADLARLEWIQLGSHGYAQLAGHHLPDRTVVTNASGVQDRPIAEWVVLMLLALGRRFPDMVRAQREHRWDRDDAYQLELRGMPVGVLGFGSIGREVARILQPLDLPVHVMTRTRTRNRDRGARFDPLHRSPAEIPEPDRWFTFDQRAEFYQGIRALVVAVPDSSGTRGLVDADAIAGMPRGASLLNPARARVVDEQALLAALHDGQLGGAALDDHYRQPMPPDDPFWDAPNTIVTAHISGSTGSPWYRQRIWELFLENARRRAANEPMLNVIARADLDLA